MIAAPVIFGLDGPRISSEESAFFKQVRPWGFILFARNCESPIQLRALTDSLRDLAGREDLPILIDQEGGRVQRLKPPHWPQYPAAASIGELMHTDSPGLALRAAYDIARLIADDLNAVGITVNCAPVADIRSPRMHDAIGDRAFGKDPQSVAKLAGAFADGLLEGGVLPVLKHLPGYGRATVDPHTHLPRISAPLEELKRKDLEAFRPLNALPMAMTAHAVFEALDADCCATQSGTILKRLVREEIGFTGLLMSDDLNMKALGGGLGERADSALNAGCDVVLHGSGNLQEMEAVARNIGHLQGEPLERANRALACRKTGLVDVERGARLSRLQGLVRSE